MKNAILASLALLSTLSGTTLGASPCPSGPYAGYYIYPEDRCNTLAPPTIVVKPASDGISAVSFTQNGGAVDIGITAVNDGNGSSFITIEANGSHIGIVGVTSANSIDVELTISTSGNVGGVLMDEGSSIQSMWVNGEISGDLGSVKATGITSVAALVPLTVHGDLIGDIYLVDRVNDADLRLVGMIIDGNIAGGVVIDMESGGIGQLLVEGAIGESGDPVTILSGRDITSIVTGEMFADIVVMREESMIQYWGNIRTLRTDKLLGSGDFVGTIHANSVGEPIERSLEMTPADGPQIEIQGDLGDGTTTTYLEFESALSFDGTFHNAQIVVGGSFLDESTIEMPSGGLEGQIIINRDDDSEIWESGAEIIVGATTLTAPGYTVTAQSLGGGAAGLAPFGFHFESCDPPATSSTPGEMELVGELDIVGFEIVCIFPNPPVDIQFKGGVGRFTGVSGLPVIVEKYAGGGVWTDISNSFGFAMAPGGDDKQVRLTRSVGWVDGSYRVRRRSGHLYCAEVADEETEVTNFTYYFDVTKVDCEGSLLAGFDLDLDMAVTEPGDVPAWLMGPLDFNNDSATDSDDIAILESAATLYNASPSSPVYYTGPWTLVE